MTVSIARSATTPIQSHRPCGSPARSTTAGSAGRSHAFNCASSIVRVSLSESGCSWLSPVAIEATA
jgi:hypothetical protein